MKKFVLAFVSNELLPKRRGFIKYVQRDLGDCYEYFLW